MTRKIFLIISLALVLALAGCGATTTTTTSTSSTSAYTTTKLYDYSDFANQTITDKSQQLTMSAGTYYIYLYGPTCTHCEQIKQQALSLIDSITSNSIYIVAISQLADVNDTIRSYANDEIFTPSLIKISNHEVAYIYVGGDTVLSELTDMTK